MALERALHRSCGHIPEPGRLVVRGRCHQLAVRRECDGADQTRMALEDLQSTAPVVLHIRYVTNPPRNLLYE